MKRYIVQVNNNKYEVFIKEADENIKDDIKVTGNKEKNRASVVKENEILNLENNPSTKAKNNDLPVVAPMSGKILSIKVNEGDRVKKGEILLTLEAMKMETEINSPVSGTVTDITVTTGENCRRNDKLLYIQKDGYN